LRTSPADWLYLTVAPPPARDTPAGTIQCRLSATAVAPATTKSASGRRLRRLAVAARVKSAVPDPKKTMPKGEAEQASAPRSPAARARPQARRRLAAATPRHRSQTIQGRRARAKPVSCTWPLTAREYCLGLHV
jgi:hypothetical protein